MRKSDPALASKQTCDVQPKFWSSDSLFIDENKGEAVRCGKGKRKGVAESAEAKCRYHSVMYEQK
jgi:hypothetical protein